MVVRASRKSLVNFQIATNDKYQANWHHELIAKELEHVEAFGDRDYKILLLSVPPRHGKSQQATIDFPAWYLGRNPDKEVITASYSAELALDFGTKTRTKIESEQYQYIFPGTQLKADERAKAKWRTNDEGSYTSVGVGGSITGRGADLFIIDDPIKNREEADSEVYRNKIWNWFTSTAFTRLEPGGVVVLILTRWHDDDLAGRILNNPELSKRLKIMNFPAIAEIDDAYRHAGKALWPQKYNKEALDEIKTTIGPYDWSSLYQQTPVLSENQEFKNGWFRQIGQVEVERMNTRKFLTIDTAMSKKAQADFTGFCDNSINTEKFWHLKAWQMKIGPEELVDAIFNLHRERRYEKIGIEKTAYLDGLKPYLDQEQIKRGTFLPIVELRHNSTAKEIRIRGLIPRYSSGSVYHIDGFCKDLENQMIRFPFGAHDDVLDAVAYQEQIVAQDEELNSRVGQYRPKFSM